MISRRNDRRLGVSGTDWVKNGDRWIVTDVRADGALSVRHATSRLHATLPAKYVAEHVELGYASTVHTAQGITTDVVHGIVTGTEDRQMLYTMLTRGRVANHAHIVLTDEPTHALPSPTVERAMTATEVLEGILARDGAAVSATSTQARATSPAGQFQDAVTQYADAVALATSQLRADPDLAERGPLPWLAASLPRWCRIRHGVRTLPPGSAESRRSPPRSPPIPCCRSGRRSTTTSSPRSSGANWLSGEQPPACPSRSEQWSGGAARRPGGGVPPQAHQPDQHPLRRGREELGRPHRRVRRQSGRADWRAREHLDTLARKGIDAERVLHLAAARRPLPVDHATAALGYRVKDLTHPEGTPSTRVDRPIPAVAAARQRPDAWNVTLISHW